METIATGSTLINPVEVLKKVGVDTAMRIGDLGCGNGYFSLVAAQLVGSEGRVFAVDILKTSLGTVENEAQHQGFTNVRTVWSNLEIIGATKIPEESLDMVFVKNALYQSANKANFLTESARLLKPGGKMVIIEWLDRPTNIGPPLNDRIGMAEIKSLLEQVPELEYQEDFDPGTHHYGLIVIKK